MGGFALQMGNALVKSQLNCHKKEPPYSKKMSSAAVFAAAHALTLR